LTKTLLIRPGYRIHVKMYRIKSTFVVLLVLSLVLVTFPQIEVVKAEATIYIRSDGSVEGTDKIQRTGNIYIFKGDITGSIILEKDDIVLDGAGLTFKGSKWAVTFEYEKGIYASFRNNITIQNIKLTGYGNCILLENTNNSKVIQNEIISDLWETGIKTTNSTNITISNNHLTHIADPYSSQAIGIQLDYSANNTISFNNLTGGWWRGIALGPYADNNKIYNNNLTENQVGIQIVSDNNQIFQNNICSSVSIHRVPNEGTGILLSGSLSAENNTIFKNNLSNHRVAIDLRNGSANVFYFNNFVNISQENVDVRLEFSFNNMWDNGEVGNFWSDYIGTDNNEDGIGDTPYIINLNNQDNYPLMQPVIIPEFPSLTVFLIMVIIIGGVTIIYKNNLQKHGIQ
jgi:parallel beta-helix repeat protein